MENNEVDVDGLIKKERKDKSKFKSCSYKCQFCEKSFPRLGYLKKHEQVSELLNCIPLTIGYRHSLVTSQLPKHKCDIHKLVIMIISPFIIMTHGL
jgi:hypothetical protein